MDSLPPATVAALARHRLILLVALHLVFAVLLGGCLGVFGLVTVDGFNLGLLFAMAGVGAAAGATVCAIAALLARVALTRGAARPHLPRLAIALSRVALAAITATQLGVIVCGVLVAMRDSDEIIVSIVFMISITVPVVAVGAYAEDVTRTIRRAYSGIAR